jgi:hypothetical protein
MGGKHPWTFITTTRSLAGKRNRILAKSRDDVPPVAHISFTEAAESKWAVVVTQDSVKLIRTNASIRAVPHCKRGGGTFADPRVPWTTIPLTALSGKFTPARRKTASITVELETTIRAEANLIRKEQKLQERKISSYFSTEGCMSRQPKPKHLPITPR